MRERGFKFVKGEESNGNKLPTRGTSHSAGYDFYLPQEMVIKPRETAFMFTNVKAYMMDDEFLSLHVRSSIGIKKKLMLSNTTGIVDSDYYGNDDNDGNIGVAIYNYGNEVVELPRGTRIMQGIFQKYLTVDSECMESKNKRSGGFGHTGE